jgi:hypothetical protein
MLGLEILANGTKCMFMSRHYNTEEKHYIKADDEFFENIPKF